MFNRNWGTIRIWSCLGLLMMTGSVVFAQEKSRPNVLFIICDDLNCDIGCYGHSVVQTPNIDALANRGVRFDRAYCQYSLCGPSRASFMAGVYPDQTLIRRNAIYLREHLPDVNTMSQMFRDASYKATRIGKIYHYNVPNHIGTAGHDDPFSWSNTFNPEGRDVHDEDKIFSLIPGSFGGTLSWLAADGTDSEQTDGIAAKIADEQLRMFASREIPFFLAVGLYRPHTPFVAPKKYFEMYPPETLSVPDVPEDYLATLPAPARTSITRKKQNALSVEMKQKVLQAYYASITFADAQIGAILQSLRDTGLEKNTIVVFTSDHGYHMGEHGHFQKTTLFENAARVPLIMAGPGVEGVGQSTRSLAELVDVYPTLAELAGLAKPEYLQGVSLVPALSDSNAVCRQSALTQYATGYSLRSDLYRLTAWGEDGRDGIEFYDHRHDEEELINLASDPAYAAVIEEQRVALLERVAAARKAPPGLTQLVFDDVRKVPQKPVRH